MDIEKYEERRRFQYGSLVLALMLAITVILPSPVIGEATEETRMDALEARVTALEAQLAALLSDEGGDVKATEAPQESEPHDDEYLLGETMMLDEGHSVTMTTYETGTSFRYSPAGGFSTLRLSAKNGYRLLCLYVTVENNAASELNTARLLDTVLEVGSDYSSKAQDSFFYLNNRGVYAGGLKVINPGAKVQGCLLFAVPEDIDESSERIAVQMAYGDDTFACTLRPGGISLELGDPETF